ncbi:hypothetical protein AB0E69_31975 [Kribbella sp. NPDC026611]|uniref:hypothetical protein n=1 Tax=Kribbella sp. NPDC026611 TaxID=3154911 RepID=UPI0033C172AC
MFSRNPDSGDDKDDGDGTSFWQERGFVAGGIVIGAVLICLLVWFLARDNADPSAQPSENQSTSVPSEPESTGEPSGPPATPETQVPLGTKTPKPTPPPLHNGTGGCHDARPNQQVPQLAPPAVSWQFDGDMLIPLQAEAGPAETSPSGVRSCFAKSPTGAVFAAMVLLGQLANQQVAEDVLQARVLPGPGREKALAQARDTSTPPTPIGVQFAGFKVIDYYGNRAVIQVAAKINEQAVAALPVTMQWTKGDWKAVLQPDGSFNGQVKPDVLQTMDGYVKFSGAD